MTLAIEIAVGIWLGGLFLIGTFAAYFSLASKIEHNRNYGHPWYRGIWRIQ